MAGCSDGPSSWLPVGWMGAPIGTSGWVGAQPLASPGPGDELMGEGRDGSAIVGSAAGPGVADGENGPPCCDAGDGAMPLVPL